MPLEHAGCVLALGRQKVAFCVVKHPTFLWCMMQLGLDDFLLRPTCVRVPDALKVVKNSTNETRTKKRDTQDKRRLVTNTSLKQKRESDAVAYLSSLSSFQLSFLQ